MRFEFAPIVTARTGLPNTITQNNLNPAAAELRPNVVVNSPAGLTTAARAARLLQLVARIEF